jgi:Protein of unknown function (DUF1320)
MGNSRKISYKQIAPKGQGLFTWQEDVCGELCTQGKHSDLYYSVLQYHPERSALILKHSNFYTMPIITSADLATNIYGEIITEITRADTTITDRAITAAMQEAKMYLNRYDLLQLFGNESTPPEVQDEYLKSLVKDLACWHLLRLSNTNVDYSALRTGYQDAIAVLKNIQSGCAAPEGWPYADTTSETAVPGDSISWSSNPKRNNYY